MTELPLISPGMGPDPLVHDQNDRLLREKFNAGIDSTDISTGGVSHDNIANGIPPTKLQGAYATGTTTIENTTTESNLVSVTFAAGDAVDRHIRLTIIGAVNNNSGAGRTIQFRLFLASSVIWGETTASLAASATFRAFTTHIDLGVNDGFQVASGSIRISPATAGTFGGFGGTPPAVNFCFAGNTSEGTGGPLTVALTAKLSAAHAAFQLFATKYTLELY